MKSSAAEWTERVAAWRASGQSASEFAAGKEYTEKLLRWWSSELSRREEKRPRVRMARVVRASQKEALVIAVGAARIEVRAGFDRALLRDVVAALRGED